MSCRISFVEPLLLLYMYCYFLVGPVQEQMIYRKVCLQTFNKTHCDIISRNTNATNDQNIVQSKTVKWNIYSTIAHCLPPAITTLLFGVFTDHIGRKKILMVPIFGDLVNGICYWINAYFFSLSVWCILIGRVVSGVCGSYATMLMGAFAYVSDITDESTRTKRIIGLESTMYLGAILSYFSSGFMLEKYGFVAVYSLVVALYLVLVVYAIFLKESYNAASRQRLRLKDVLSKDILVEGIRTLTKKRRGNDRAVLLVLVFCLFLFYFLFTGMNNITILYVLHSPLNFRPSQIGILFTEMNAFRFSGAFLVSFILVAKLKVRDYSLIVMSSLAYIGLTISFGISHTQKMMFSAPIWCLGVSSGVSSCRAAMSKLVAPGDQGKLFSVMTSLEEITDVVSITVLNLVYKYTLVISPSFTYFLMASLAIVPIVIGVVLRWSRAVGWRSD